MPSANVETRNKYDAARDLMARGENIEAARILKEIIHQEPDAYSLLREACLKINRPDISRELMEKVIEHGHAFSGKVIENTTPMYGEGMRGQSARLLEEVGKIKWFHTIDLGGGVVTPGRQHSPTTLPAYGVPDDLSGKSVLDIGAWDGFNSFEAERRHARRVLATDYYCWGGPGWGTQDGFNLARRVLGSKVEDLEIDVMDLNPERVGTFDLVLFLGVLYHMRYPMKALERVFSVTGDMMILETHVDMLQVERPVAAFYPDIELGGDPTHWWGPNTAAVIGMLKAVGYRRVEEFSLVKTPVRIVKGDVEEEIHQGRLVVHAWR